MPALGQFTLGNDCVVVLIGPFGRVDLQKITRFNARQLVHNVKVRPLNSPPLQADVPDGWEVTFEMERANNAAETLFSQIGNQFWGRGIIGVTSMYQYLAEPDGSTTTWQFVTGTVRFSDAGDFSIDKAVRQRIEGFFSERLPG